MINNMFTAHTLKEKYVGGKRCEWKNMYGEMYGRRKV